LGLDPSQPLADLLHVAWVAFAATGARTWPKYDLGRRTTMRFATTLAVVDDPRAAVRSLGRRPLVEPQ
jgi:para-nitrobenzyl esterase